MNKDKKWIYHKPKFEYEKKLNDSGWPWAGHKLFAYDLIINLKPKKVVELGTYYGTSLWSFAQAAKDGNLDIEFNSIDTWQGEKHSGFYGEEVFETVKKIKKEFYSEQKIKLLRKTFDEALSEFEEDSIDLLHIDGLHTYEAVKHDFEAWLPKLKKDGVIIFHDIKVGESDFGVYNLWNELTKQYLTIEFHHSFGLGVLFLSEKDKESVWKSKEELQRYYYYAHEISRGEDLNFLSNVIGQKDQEIQTKNQEIQIKNQEIELFKSSKFWKLRNLYIKAKEQFFLRRKYKIIKDLVTVIIPVYDRTWELRESINSILGQTYKKFEIILVTDGSPEQTIKVLEEYKNSPKVRIFYYYDNSGNAVRGRNRGIKEAKGKFIAFQDSDDIAEPTRLENSLEFIAKHNVDVVYGGWRAILDGTRTDTGLTNGQEVISPDCDLEMLKGSCVPCQSTVMVKKSALLDVGGLKTKMKYREDHELWLRLFHFGYKLKAIPEVLTNLRLHKGNNELNFKDNDSHWYKLMIEEYKTKANNGEK
jgi:GT2 family glycosyltransferase